jgi:hypothetical protein
MAGSSETAEIFSDVWDYGHHAVASVILHISAWRASKISYPKNSFSG